MSEQEFYARDMELQIEINDHRARCQKAQTVIYEANCEMTKLENERIRLRQESYNAKIAGGQNHD